MHTCLTINQQYRKRTYIPPQIFYEEEELEGRLMAGSPRAGSGDTQRSSGNITDGDPNARAKQSSSIFDDSYSYEYYIDLDY